MLMFSTVGCSTYKRLVGAEDSSAAPNVAGVWTGTYQTNLIPTSTMTLTLTQDGVNVSGGWGDHFYASCPIYEGRVNGSAIRFELPDHFNGGPGNLCVGEFTITGTVTGGNMVLNINGSNCVGVQTGTANLERTL